MHSKSAVIKSAILLEQDGETSSNLRFDGHLAALDDLFVKRIE